MGRVVLEEAQDTADDRVGEGPVPGRCLRLGAGEPGSQRGDDQREPFLDVRDIADVMVAALTSAMSWSGSTRQFTFAFASWGSAFGACPPSSWVATHVVRMVALYTECADNRRAAAVSLGSRAIARMSAAVWPVSTFASCSKYPRVTSFRRTGKSKLARRPSAAERW